MFAKFVQEVEGLASCAESQFVLKVGTLATVPNFI
jgi:hypothetical protein